MSGPLGVALTEETRELLVRIAANLDEDADGRVNDETVYGIHYAARRLRQIARSGFVDEDADEEDVMPDPVPAVELWSDDGLARVAALSDPHDVEVSLESVRSLAAEVIALREAVRALRDIPRLLNTLVPPS